MSNYGNMFNKEIYSKHNKINNTSKLPSFPFAIVYYIRKIYC